MRRFWQPVALSEEVAEDSPLPIRVLGEDLVLFRDDHGLGLLGLHCSHRGADLSYGRLDDGGLRCIYHGWLYDVHGRCLDQPGEPEGGRARDSIRHPAYPCQERAGAIFAYMGPGEPPPLPDYGFLLAPEEHVLATKHLVECNYLQGTEGSADAIHLSFLHYNKLSESVGPFSSRGAAPTLERLEADSMDSGFRICKIRSLESGNSLFVGTFVLPTLFAFAAGRRWDEGYVINWHVPLDDTHFWEYAFEFDRETPLDKEAVGEQRMEGISADYKPIGNRGNRYLQNRRSMKAESYSGIGEGFAFDPQDVCILEGMGAIQDRTREHLVSSDLPTVLIRKLLAKSVGEVQEGRDPPRWVRDEFPDIFVYRGLIPKTTNWKEYCRQLAAGIQSR
jgi:nitrite reductase/ring-hydroxylating ferredoxin subunit